ncbi:hypothetical protein LJC46_01415 [Desulfovibrio sp. OttesenSCG-928-G15]|nr:hypothetical protein [Desulfovibrio sp. OttesenSCG-928-G15]
MNGSDRKYRFEDFHDDESAGGQAASRGELRTELRKEIDSMSLEELRELFVTILFLEDDDKPRSA